MVGLSNRPQIMMKANALFEYLVSAAREKKWNVKFLRDCFWYFGRTDMIELAIHGGYTLE